jgi:diguanylate cyclase (GGDEF)-like protein
MNTDTLGLLDEINFSYLKKSMESVLSSAMDFVGDDVLFFQVSLISREKNPNQKEFMTIKWYSMGQRYPMTNEARPYFDKGEPIVRGESSLLWDVIDSEVKGMVPVWGNLEETQKLFDRVGKPVPPHVERFYLGNIQHPEAKKKAINVVGKEHYKSSVLIPIWITPMRPAGDLGTRETQKRLVGVMSLDCEYSLDKLNEKADALRHVCALADLVGRTVEALDMAFYDFLAGNHGVLSNAFYFKCIESLPEEERQKLALAFFDLNNFKRVNDDHDHEEGSKVLSQFARQIVDKCNVTDFLRGSSWLCRFGGDEFMLLAEVDDIRRFQHWLCEQLMEEKSLCSCSRHPISPSIGIATWRAATQAKAESPWLIAASTMQALADEAMYASKQVYKELKREKRWAAILYDTSREEIKALDKQKDLRALVEKNTDGVKNRE